MASGQLHPFTLQNGTWVDLGTLDIGSYGSETYAVELLASANSESEALDSQPLDTLEPTVVRTIGVL